MGYSFVSNNLESDGFEIGTFQWMALIDLCKEISPRLAKKIRDYDSSGRWNKQDCIDFAEYLESRLEEGDSFLDEVHFKEKEQDLKEFIQFLRDSGGVDFS
jgi:hypothetical protein